MNHLETIILKRPMAFRSYLRQRGIPNIVKIMSKFNNENFLEKLNEVVENYRFYEEK